VFAARGRPALVQGFRLSLFWAALVEFDFGNTPFSQRYAASARRMVSASGVPCCSFRDFRPASRSSEMKNANRRTEVQMYACMYLHVNRAPRLRRSAGPGGELSAGPRAGVATRVSNSHNYFLESIAELPCDARLIATSRLIVTYPFCHVVRRTRGRRVLRRESALRHACTVRTRPLLGREKMTRDAK
jgi:hypothetical protein